MAGIGNTFYDLSDMQKQKDPDGSMADVIDMLVELNPMLQDAQAVECNNGTTHRHTVRTGLPELAWGRLYKGVKQSKSTNAQVDDTTGFVEGLSSIDQRVLKLSENKAAVRLNEADGFLEAMAQEIQSKLLYGNQHTNPEQFTGLAPRFGSLSAKTGKQIVDAGGTGFNNTSIWIVTWSDRACHTIYPKGMPAGVEREDKGEQKAFDENNNSYFVEEEMFTQHIGLALKDWRYVTRIANIDVDAMRNGSVQLYDFLRTAYYKLQSRRVPNGRQVIYCNTDVLEALDALATNAGTNDSFVRLKPMEVQGQEVLSYRGIPIRETDAILNTEERVI